MLSGRGITAWLIKMLMLLGILPSGKLGFLDWFKFSLLAMVQVLMAALWFYEIRNHIQVRLIDNFSLQTVMQSISSFIMPPVQCLGLSLILGFPKNFPKLLAASANIKTPTALITFLTILLLNAWILYNFVQYMYVNIVFTISQAITMVQQIICLYVVGLSLANWSTAADNSKAVFDINSAITVGQAEIANYKSLKNYLSPLMLGIILPNGFMMVSNAYMLFSTSINQVLLLSTILCSTFNILYICYIANDGFIKFKAWIPVLRLNIFIN